MTNHYCILLLLALMLSGCDSDSTVVADPTLPDVIQECETNTARVCGTWTRQPNTNTYLAQWTQGSQAVVTVVQLDSRAAIFTRKDTGGPTADMVARYIGFADGKTVQKGQVRWTTGGLTFYGTFDAQW